MKRFKRYLTRIIEIVSRPEMRDLPGQIAFFMVLSFVPILTVVGLIASRFSIPLNNLVNAISTSLPSDIGKIVVGVLSSPGTVSMYSIILGFYIASNGACSIIITSNMLFKLKDSDYIKRRIKALIMLVILVLLFLFIIVVLGYGNTIFNLTVDYFNIKLPAFTYYIFYLLKWLVAVIIIFILVKLLLTFAPDQEIPSKYMTRGTIFITISWAVVTSIYSIYANNFANYNVFYSSLANVVVLMFWIYILSYLLVLGIAINSEKYLYLKGLEEEQERKKQEEQQEKKEEIEEVIEESNE